MADRTTPENLDKLPDSAMVSDTELSGLLGVSKNTAWRWSKAGRLPSPVKIGPNTTRWNLGEVRAALAKMVAA
jgi:prophage regulatory protein